MISLHKSRIFSHLENNCFVSCNASIQGSWEDKIEHSPIDISWRKKFVWHLTSITQCFYHIYWVRKKQNNYLSWWNIRKLNWIKLNQSWGWSSIVEGSFHIHKSKYICQKNCSSFFPMLINPIANISLYAFSRSKLNFGCYLLINNLWIHYSRLKKPENFAFNLFQIASFDR